ncbi:MAG: GTP diphosphokinase [Gammaproteobacteria bacterium]|nr:GTP diphosphokinase [Gammaproteobacteria bacterium]
MRATRQYNLIQRTYSIDEYLRKISRKPVSADSLLYKACERIWQLEPDPGLPSSLDVALLLSELGSDETTLVVGLLSTTRLIESEDGEQLRRVFGDNVMRLVDNVIQLHSIQTHRQNKESPQQAERLRRMLLSMVQDVRVVLIKLAFRVQRLRQLGDADTETRIEVAQESLDIFAPIANRLGIGQLKWELEDLSFRHLEPSTYKRIAKYLEETRDSREQFIHDVVAVLKQILTEAGIEGDVYGRPKHIYSIWKKMTAKQRDFNELFDVRAVRILVDSVADCYAVLGLVHGKWRHIDKEFDDYIANPKENGYQSLHTAVHGPGGKPIEVQIRTHKMHEFAEHGIAAHWRYKEGRAVDKQLETGIESLRKLLDPSQTEDDELLDSFRAEMFQDRVFVLTPEGRVIDLPMGATPLDFAYAVHSEVGHRCRGAKVNGHIVQLTYALKNGQQVEILTSKESAPRRDWLIPHLGYIKTSRARSRIKSWFRKQDEADNLHDGKAIYEREIKRLDLRPDSISLLKRLKQKSLDDVYIALARGDISNAQLLSALHENLTPESGDKLPLESVPRALRKKKAASDINVLGVGNLLTTMANCCRPVPGDDIIGFITQGKGVTIHRKDCSNILNLKEENRLRLVEVEWGEPEVQTYPVTLLIEALDRQGLLSDITRTLADEKVNVVAVNTLSDKKNQMARMAVTIETRDLHQLHRVMDKIQQLHNVTEVVRGAHNA